MNGIQLLKNAEKNNRERPAARIRVSARWKCKEADNIAGQFKNIAHTGVYRTGSMGYYDLEPFVIVEEPGFPAVCYARVGDSSAAKIAENLTNGAGPVSEWALGTLSGGEFQGIDALDSIPLFNIQRRVASKRCGFAEPLDIDNYIAEFGGYSGLINALAVSPSDVRAAIEAAGLRERGGLGLPVSAWWKVFTDKEKTIVCNAADNDIESRASVMLLEGDPHGALEGLLIAAYAAGASKAVLAVPEGEALEVLCTALEQMSGLGLCGENILESGFSCGIELRKLPRALILSENTALLRYLEGFQAIPSEKNIEELGGGQVFVTGAETLYNLAPILLNERSEQACATKIITITGIAGREYTLEIPFGTLVGDIIRAAGIEDGVKAFQYGGPTSGFFGSEALSKPVSFETAREAGAGFGHALLNIVPDGSCAVEAAGQITSFLRGESCGKCVFCREGLLHLSRMLEDLASGSGGGEELELISALGGRMKTNCICEFGRTAANPVLSALNLFRSDFEHHAKLKKCPQPLANSAVTLEGGHGNGGN